MKSNLNLKFINLKNPKISFLPQFDLLLIVYSEICPDVRYYIMWRLESLSRSAVSQNNLTFSAINQNIVTKPTCTLS